MAIPFANIIKPAGMILNYKSENSGSVLSM